MKPNLEADFMRWHHAGAEFYNSGVRLLASLGIAAARMVIRGCEAVYRMHPQPKIRKQRSRDRSRCWFVQDSGEQKYDGKQSAISGQRSAKDRIQ